MRNNILTNYYTRKEDLEEELLQGIRLRRIDEKFSFTGKRQANAWFNLCNSPEYEYYRSSKELLKKTAKDFVSGHQTDVNVIALGPGNGLKEKIVVEAFQEDHEVSLFFVDISREVLNVAVENVEDNDALQEVFVADLVNFEDIEDLSEYVRDQYNPTNFFTLLGNTLGNLSQPLVLETMRNAMAPGEKLLVDVRCKSPKVPNEEELQIAKTIEAYDNPANRERIQGLLSAAGIEETDGIIDFEFGKDDYFPEMDVIKKFFRFTQSKTITYRRQTIHFAKNERILVGYANKYSFGFLENLFNSHGLRIIRNALDSTGRINQLLCELA